MTTSTWVCIGACAAVMGGSALFGYWYKKQLKAGKTHKQIRDELLLKFKDSPKSVKEQLASVMKKSGLDKDPDLAKGFEEAMAAMNKETIDTVVDAASRRSRHVEEEVK